MYFAFHRACYILLSPYRLGCGHPNIICCRAEESCLFQVLAGRYTNKVEHWRSPLRSQLKGKRLVA